MRIYEDRGCYVMKKQEEGERKRKEEKGGERRDEKKRGAQHKNGGEADKNLRCVCKKPGKS